jgi:hypothetical protein
MLPQVFHDKEDHECQGNQNQPSYGKLSHDKEDKEDKEGRECHSNHNRPGHGKLLYGGGGLNVVSFGLTSIFLISGGANDFNPMRTFLSDFLESALSTQ